MCRQNSFAAANSSSCARWGCRVSLCLSGDMATRPDTSICISKDSKHTYRTASPPVPLPYLISVYSFGGILKSKFLPVTCRLFNFSSHSPQACYLQTAGVEVVHFHLIALRHTTQSVRLLWTRDRPVAETSDKTNTAQEKKINAPWLDSNPRSQQAFGRRPTP
jgi:hypothetical protein